MKDGKSVDRVVDLTLPLSRSMKNLVACGLGPPSVLALYGTLPSAVSHGGKLHTLTHARWQACYLGALRMEVSWLSLGLLVLHHEGVKQLFRELDFPATSARYDLTRVPFPGCLGRIIYFGGGHYLRGLVADTLKLVGRLGMLRWLVGCCCVAPTMINMIGVRRSS